jgi:hypothetical protein
MAVLISYVDDGTIIVQSDMWDKDLVKLKLAYKIVFELTQSMGLVLKHSCLLLATLCVANSLNTNECYTAPVCSPLLCMGADYGFTRGLL